MGGLKEFSNSQKRYLELLDVEEPTNILPFIQALECVSVEQDSQSLAPKKLDQFYRVVDKYPIKNHVAVPTISIHTYQRI